VALTRTPQNLIGTPTSPSTLAAGASANGTFDLTATAGTYDGSLAVVVTTGATPPTVATTITWQDSYDGTNFLAATRTQSVILSVASTSTLFGPYCPSPGVEKVKVTVINGDGSQSLTAYAQGGGIAGSNL
jgi:hypothetical protein